MSTSLSFISNLIRNKAKQDLTSPNSLETTDTNCQQNVKIDDNKDEGQNKNRLSTNSTSSSLWSKFDYDLVFVRPNRSGNTQNSASIEQGPSMRILDVVSSKSLVSNASKTAAVATTTNTTTTPNTTKTENDNLLVAEKVKSNDETSNRKKSKDDTTVRSTTFATPLIKTTSVAGLPVSVVNGSPITPTKVMKRNFGKPTRKRFYLILGFVGLIFVLMVVGLIVWRFSMGYTNGNNGSNSSRTGGDIIRDISFKKFQIANSTIHKLIPLPSDPTQWMLARDDGQYSVYDSKTNTTKLTVGFASNAAMTNLVYNGQASRAIGVHFDGAISVFDPTTGTMQHVHRLQTGWLRGLALNRQGDHIFTLGQGGDLKVYDMAQFRMIRNFTAVASTIHDGWVTEMNADETLIYCGGTDSNIREFDASGTQLRRMFSGHSGVIKAISVNAIRNSLFSGSTDKTVLRFDLQSSSLIQTFNAEHEITCLTVSYKLNWVIAGGPDGSITVWDLKSSKVVLFLKLQQATTGIITSVSLLEDTRVLLTTSTDGSVLLWPI